MKALYIVVNVGFADEIVNIARTCGARGATIMNARGAGSIQKAILGITVDSEKEIIVSVVEDAVADAIIKAVKAKESPDFPAKSVCFTIPVDKYISKGNEA